MALTMIITNAGRAALVNAQNTGTAPVTIAQCGISATALVPTPATALLPGEFKRINTLSGDVVADDTIHLIVRDESTDDFAVRSFALYLQDGTLFAIYGQAAPILEKTAQSIMLLALDIRFADINATELTFGDANFLNPPATTTVQGVVELATDAETETGTDTQRATTPKGVKSAVTSWLNSRFGAGAPSTFVKTLLVAASAIAMRASLEIKSAALKDEGAGNNLDADLLDGQHGTYYANIPARLGYNPWGPSNDGSGSGLDADLLDGQQGTYYTDIVARLGYTPLNATAYTAVDVRAKILTVDGSGSGIDADLLDGQEGSYYRDLANATGVLPNARLSGDYTGITIDITGSKWLKNQEFGIDLSNSDIIGVNGLFFADDANLDGEEGIMFRKSGTNDPYDMASYDCLRGRNSVLYWAGSIVWHTDNDGSGSGLDADLLDGQHGSFYQNLVNSTGILPNAQLSGSYDGLTELGSSRIRLTSTTTANLSSTGHAFQIGADGGNNLAASPTAIQARSNGAASIFHLNYYGGDVRINNSLAWNAGNDGAGSGLDADLLDGQQGSYYQNLANSTGTLPNARISGAYDGVTTFTANEVRIVNADYKLSVSGQLRQIQFSAGCLLSYSTTSSRFIFTQGGTDILYLAANGDLSGPGGSAYDRIISSSMGQDGYIVYASGLKILWGRVNVNQDSYSTVTYPFTFDTTPCPVFPTLHAIENNAQQNTQLGTWSRTGFQIYQAADYNGSLPYHVIGK